jgi:hypothetical protein
MYHLLALRSWLSQMAVTPRPRVFVAPSQSHRAKVLTVTSPEPHGA